VGVEGKGGGRVSGGWRGREEEGVGWGGGEHVPPLIVAFTMSPQSHHDICHKNLL
jgi:hypothetical protein